MNKPKSLGGAIAVYDPPEPHFPFLSVVITEEGVSAEPFPTFEEAQAHCDVTAAAGGLVKDL